MLIITRTNLNRMIKLSSHIKTIKYSDNNHNTILGDTKWVVHNSTFYTNDKKQISRHLFALNSHHSCRTLSNMSVEHREALLGQRSHPRLRRWKQHLFKRRSIYINCKVKVPNFHAPVYWGCRVAFLNGFGGMDIYY